MTLEIAQTQLAKLKQERASAEGTVAEYQSRIAVLDVQMPPLEKLIADLSKAARVPPTPSNLCGSFDPTFQSPLPQW